jgi:hypothetical protein
MIVLDVSADAVAAGEFSEMDVFPTLSNVRAELNV